MSVSVNRSLVREIDRPKPQVQVSKVRKVMQPLDLHEHIPRKPGLSLEPVRGNRSAQLASGARSSAGVEVIDSMRELLLDPLFFEDDAAVRRGLARATHVVISHDESAHKASELHLCGEPSPASLARENHVSNMSEAVAQYLSNVVRALISDGNMSTGRQHMLSPDPAGECKCALPLTQNDAPDKSMSCLFSCAPQSPGSSNSFAQPGCDASFEVAPQHAGGVSSADACWRAGELSCATSPVIADNNLGPESAGPGTLLTSRSEAIDARGAGVKPVELQLDSGAASAMPAIALGPDGSANNEQLHLNSSPTPTIMDFRIVESDAAASCALRTPGSASRSSFEPALTTRLLDEQVRSTSKVF